MRCFYCAEREKRSSVEHVPSAFLGSRLKTRKVCQECNERAGREIDERLAAYLMVRMPKALADVRSLRHQQKEPVVDVDGIVSATGEPVKVRFSPGGRAAFRFDGTPTDEVVEVCYGMESDLWVRFAAKVALGCAAHVFDDGWHDHPTAVAVRSLLWCGSIDPAVWPPPQGIPGWPSELPQDHAVRQALGDDRHMVGLIADDDDPGSSIAMAMLFGGQITCTLPLPGHPVSGTGVVWVLDWHPGAPP
ncbi:MAG: HNH endonuclease, partial [Patulibacter sp.]